ncbi:MAG: LysM peptidoglycan-binding domain-containing protein [Desulfobacterales bacterium]|nr:LysM peptidoglycan-binding domain-containing protein [Desulfobacterales bacterium]
MKIRFRYFTRISIVFLIPVCICLGCAGIGQKFDELGSTIKEKIDFKKIAASFKGDTDGEKLAQSHQKTGYFTHTSKWSWETLAYVAEWYTGDSHNWKTLAKINPHVRPQKVAGGSKVLIPIKLLKTREPLPSNFAVKYHKDYFKHTVRWSGESLSLIANWYTGAFRNWKKLAKANPRIKPNHIKLGDVIWIPPRLLKTKKELPQKVAARYTPYYFAHTVKRDGENLQEIAGWYTGDAGNWKALAQANPKINAHRLVVGNEIFIPGDLLKVREPIPVAKKLRSTSETETRPIAEEPEVIPAEEEKIKLFGPKQFPRS